MDLVTDSVNMVELEIYNINNVQPDGFKDAVIIKKAPIFLGMRELRLETENPIRFLDDDMYMVRPVQEIFNQKFKLQFIVNGKYNLDQIRYARKIIVKQENELNQDAVVMDFTRELIANDTYKCEMTYFDRSENNVVEYLKSSWLTQTDQDIEKYEFKYSPSGSIYTRISPSVISPAPEQESYNNSDKNVLTKSVLRETKTFTFYVNETDLIALQRGVHYYPCSITGLGIQADLLPALKISPLAGSDIYKVDIDFIYNIQKIYL